MSKWLSGALALLGVTVGGIVTWAFWRIETTMTIGAISIAIMATMVLCLFLVFAAFTAGLAWVETRGPEVSIGPLAFDAVMNIFYVWVSNGDIPATVRFRIVRVLDSDGLERTERSWQGHWRGKLRSFDGDMPPNDRIQYGLLAINKHKSGNPCLIIFSREPGDDQPNPDSEKHTGLPVSRDVRLEDQGDLIITVTVECFATVDGKAERTKMPNLEFVISPDPESHAGYRITKAE